MIIDPNGSVGRFVREDDIATPTAATSPYGKVPYNDQYQRSPSPYGGITQQMAIEKALNHTGGGRVEKVKPSHGGWEIEISRGMIKGNMKVKVTVDGTVHVDKHSHMDMLDFDFG